MRAHLFCTIGGRNAEYILELKRQGGGFVVEYTYGKIGTKLRSGLHRDTKVPVSWDIAAKAFNRTLAEKVSEGYEGEGQDAFAGADASETNVEHRGTYQGVRQYGITGQSEITPSRTTAEKWARLENASRRAATTPAPATQRSMTFGIGDRYDCELLTEISEREALRFIRSGDYLARLKEDGDRCGIRKFADGRMFGVNRKGELGPLPREIEDAFAGLDAESFLIDGEKLDSPTHSVVWDILELNGDDLRGKPYGDRLAILRGLVGDDTALISVVPTWEGELAKTEAVLRLHQMNAEGVVLKKASAPWKPGRSGNHYKLKFWKTATCRVCEKTARKHMDHNSAALELFDEKTRKWVLVGHTSLNGKPAVHVGDLVEVKYLNFQSQLYQPELLRVRTDVDASAAVMSQLKHKASRKDVA